MKHNRKNKKSFKTTTFRSRLFFLGVVIFSILIVLKIVYIQFFEGDFWRSKGKDQNVKHNIVESHRGDIFGDDASLLATSLPVYYVSMDPTVLPESIFNKKIDSLCLLFEQFFNEHSRQWYKDRISKKRKEGNQYIKISKKHVNYVQLKEMRQWPIIRRGRTKGGVYFERNERRVKPFNRLASRTIGYSTKNNKGVGIEYSFEQELKGSPGEALYKRTPGGNWRPLSDGNKKPAIDGNDIITTLNINLQDIVNDALIYELKKNDADYGCVALMEVTTGNIKALANLTKVKNSNPPRYVEDYNYVLGQSAEPGSTIKLASAIAILENSNLRPEDSINTKRGEYMFSDKKMEDYKSGGFGKITFQEVFEKSSNIGISTELVKIFGHQPKKYINFLNNLHLNQPIDIGIKGTGIPYIKNPSDKKNWSGTTLPWMSIGYELRLTPLHTLMLYNAVANNGKMMKPRLIEKISNADRIIQEFDTTVLKKQICSPTTLKVVKSMLEGVVERGTAKNIKDPFIKIAGKTGTVKIHEVGKGYSKKYYTSFAGYFPANNPKYSCIVVIANPRGYHQYGSDVAAPVFMHIASKINAQDLQLHDFKKITDSQVKTNHALPLIRAGKRDELESILEELDIPYKESELSEWVHTKRQGKFVVFKKKKIQNGKIPNVIGMTLRDAMFLLEQQGLVVRYDGKGRVKSQSLPSNLVATVGKQIKLELN